MVHDKEDLLMLKFDSRSSTIYRYHVRVAGLDLFLEGLSELDVKALSPSTGPFTVRDDVLAFPSFQERRLLRPLAT